MSSGPLLRRQTPLAIKLAARIRDSGPISVAEYMRACLCDEDHGVYRTRRPIGAEGDFTTAPEISQCFGELIGLWSVVTWNLLGSPAAFDLVEIGPGRGTLMADALRAAGRVPAFLAAARVRLVEPSPELSAVQAKLLAHAPGTIEWLAGYPPLDRPAIVIANELLDTEPVEQWQLTPSGWRRRAVGLDNGGHLTFATLADPSADARLRVLWPTAAPGAICEHQDWEIAGWLRTAAATEVPIAALLIDYGHSESGLGDTLQAIRSHAHEHPLASPGEADLSVQVDFARLARVFSDAGLAIDGPISQAELLGRLGIVERASRLMAANPAKAASIEAAIARLLAPNGMGSRFKAIGVRSPRLPALPGFPAR